MHQSFGVASQYLYAESSQNKSSEAESEVESTSYYLTCICKLPDRCQSEAHMRPTSICLRNPQAPEGFSILKCNRNWWRGKLEQCIGSLPWSSEAFECTMNCKSHCPFKGCKRKWLAQSYCATTRCSTSKKYPFSQRTETVFNIRATLIGKVTGWNRATAVTLCFSKLRCVTMVAPLLLLRSRLVVMWLTSTSKSLTWTKSMSSKLLHSRTHSQVGLPVLLSWESTRIWK